MLEYFSEPHDFIQTDAFSWRSDGKGGQGLEEDGRRPGGLRYYHRLRHEGYLRHLLVRKAAGTGEILVALVTTSQDPWGNVAGGAEISHRPGILPGEGASDAAVSPFGTEGRAAVSDEPGNLHGEGLSGDALPGGAEGFRESVGNGGDASFGSPESRLIEGFRERLLDLERNGRLKGRFAGILHIVNDSLADVVQSDRTDVLYGQDFFYEELLGLRFKVSLFSFFQTNTHGAEVLYETAREYIGELGSSLVTLNGVERLRTLHDFYRMGEEEYFSFDFEEAVRVSRDYKDDICNSMLKFYPTYMQDEKRYAKALFIKKYPSSLSDRFLTELATVPAHTVISIDVAPIPKDVTTSTLQKKYMGIESDIIRQQRVRNKNNDFSSDISYNKRTEKQQIEEIMDDVRENDQRLFYVAVTIIIKADTKEELEAIEETLVTIGKRNSCQIEAHYLKQREALNTALPVGVRQVETIPCDKAVQAGIV